jgi:hypothetical protein
MDTIPAVDIELLARHRLATGTDPAETYAQALEWARSTLNRNAAGGRPEDNLQLVNAALRAQNEALTLLLSAISAQAA